MNLFLDVVSYESHIFYGLVKKIRVSGSEGEIGIYPGHSRLLTFVKPGLLYILDELNQEQYIYLSGGILEIQPSEVIILADLAINSSSMNRHCILKEKKELELKIKEVVDDSKRIRFRNDLSKILAKLYVVEVMEKSRLKT